MGCGEKVGLAMTKLQRQVLEFHKVFGHPTADSPTIPADDRVRFRAAFIVEECLEFVEACMDLDSLAVRSFTADGATELMNGTAALARVKGLLHAIVQDAPVRVDLPLAVDALADIDYVVEGARLEFGVNGEPIADEVHRANMTKVGGARTPEGKTMKPPGWTPPDIEGCLDRQRPISPNHCRTESLESIILGRPDFT